MLDEENADVLRQWLDLGQTPFTVQFRQAGNAILLGRPHSQDYEDFVDETFQRAALDRQSGRSVGANICEGKLVVTVQKNNNRINNFAIQVRFDNQKFGPRSNVNYEFKEAVSNALWILKGDFGYSANVLRDNIGWSIGQPL